MDVKVTIAGEARVALKVARVAEVMAERIEANTAKGGWAHLTPGQLLDQVRGHIHELDQAVTDMTTGKLAPEEAKPLIEKVMADCQNYLFFIADNLGALNLDASTGESAVNVGATVTMDKPKEPEAAAESQEAAAAAAGAGAAAGDGGNP